jgi:hypothetical protein
MSQLFRLSQARHYGFKRGEDNGILSGRTGPQNRAAIHRHANGKKTCAFQLR